MELPSQQEIAARSEDEEAYEPGSDWILGLVLLQEKWCLTLITLSNFNQQLALESRELEVRHYRLGRHISPLSDVLGRLLVGHAHSLLSPSHVGCRGPRHGVVLIVLIEVWEEDEVEFPLLY